jgi:streptomycin 6-kinase
VALSYEEWEARLPELVAAAEERFGVRVGERFDPGAGGFVAPVSDEAVLKVGFPHFEAEREPDALALVDGDGSPRLYARADDLHAMLLERAVPGTRLWALPEEEALPLAADALERFWRPLADDHPFRPLSGEAARWAGQLPEPWGSLARELGESIEERYLLHQDFQGSNVLASERGWLVIDPKPLAGDRAFDLASLLRDRRSELTEAVVRRRFDFLTERLGVDRARARGWGIVHALAWGMDGEHPDHLAVADWLAAIDP